MMILSPFAFIGGLLAWLSGMAFLIPFIIIAYVSVGALVIGNMFRQKKVIYRVVAVAIALSLLYSIPGFYHKLKPVIQDGYVDTYMYSPFLKNSLAVSLIEPSTLKIEDNLPIIDGATALYPVYSAFAQAVYPEKEYLQYDSEVMSNRTGEAYENLLYGRADIIFVLLRPKPSWRMQND